MEQSLGKRIIANRKRVGFTQEQLAERLGVTAQAVSKWENDQSCPDITMLPKLAELFGITIDELLGVEQEVHQGEVVGETPHEADDSSESEGVHVANGNLEFRFNRTGSKESLQLAVMILFTGGLTLASEILDWDVSFWSILWPTALLVYGLFGMIPRFSFFRLGCLVFGGYFLLDNLQVLPFRFGWNLVLPVFLLLFGVSLLIDNLVRPKRKYRFRRSKKCGAVYRPDGETFDYSVTFGEDSRKIMMPRLTYGCMNTSFGESCIDLSGVEEVSDDCTVDINCSFGEATLLVPNRYRVECDSNQSFGEISVYENPNPDSKGCIHVNANASFGEIDIRYI